MQKDRDEDKDKDRDKSQLQEEELEEGLEESFPGSDAPAETQPGSGKSDDKGKSK